MRKITAVIIFGIWGGACTTVMGACIRGDDRLNEPIRDLAAGGLVLLAAHAITWAAAELTEGQT